MKEVIVKTYKFTELDTDIQDKIVQKYRESENFDYLVSEANDTFETFADIFNIKWRQIDYEEPYRNDYAINLEDHIINLSGLRLRTYIINNYYSYLFTKKYLKSGGVVDKPLQYHKMRQQKQITYKCANKGKYSISYYSNIQRTNDCTLTGVCYDYDILQPIYDFLNNPKKNIDFETLLDDCIHSLCHSVSSEIEYNLQDEQIKERIIENDYDYTETGEMF